MKFKFPILFAVLVLMPLVALVVLGTRLYSQESIVRDHQAQLLADLRLRDARSMIERFFSGLEQDSFDALQFLTLDGGALPPEQIDAIRRLVQADPILDQVFILNAAGERLFPPSTSLASRSEQAFVLNTQTLWNDQDAFRVLAAEKPVSSVGEPSAQRRPFGDGAVAQSTEDYRSRRVTTMPLSEESQADELAVVVQASRQSGWTTWDVGTETQTFFWYRDSNSNLVGQKLASAYWLSELINQLPDQRTASKLIGMARIKLVDRKQATIYQWGPFETQNEQTSEPSAQLLLGHPLDGWRLDYFSPSSATGSVIKQLFLVASLLSLGLVLLGLAVYVWREMRRDLVVAAQRVTFVNQVSHELKTPLTNICMYSDMLGTEISESDAFDRSRVLRYSDVVRAESQRLARLINNVLTFSRAQEHSVAIRIAAVEVDDVIKQTVRVFEPALTAKGIRIELDLNVPARVGVDAGILEQILNNLLSNIEKYAATGKWVKVASRLQRGVVHVQVMDAGPGIAGGSQDRVFEPFERGDSRLTQGVSGTGIGLSISRQLARAHGGDLVIQPRQQGACFELTLAVDTDLQPLDDMETI